jgi:hypothetical protein
VGKVASALWGAILMGGALFFHLYTSHNDTPVVVLALSIASVTYGGLLGTYVLAAKFPRVNGRDVITAILLTLSIMLVVIFSKRLMTIEGLHWLEPVSRLAWPWYVPLGTVLTIMTGFVASCFHPQPRLSTQ